MSDDDVKLWKQQLAEGELSQEDFDELMKGNDSLNEMDGLLKKEGPE